MKILSTDIPGVLEIIPQIFEDQRGYFFESFRESSLQAQGIRENWVQENQSFSKAGTVRGLHFQKPPFGQAKLVRVMQGKVLDVAVDLRKDSDTFGKVVVKELSAEKHNMLYIPSGFAHGFSVLEDAIFIYKCSNYYHKESEGGIIWNDKSLAIDWQVASPTLSERDLLWPSLEEFKELSGGGL